jgi:hypothetical protein
VAALGFKTKNNNNITGFKLRFGVRRRHRGPKQEIAAANAKLLAYTIAAAVTMLFKKIGTFQNKLLIVCRSRL